MESKQYQILTQVYNTLSEDPVLGGLSVNNTEEPTELNFSVASIASTSIALNETFVRARCDIHLDETDTDYSEDDIKITGAKFATAIKDNGLDVNQAIDGKHITIMSLIQYNANDHTDYNAIVGKTLAFCSAIRSEMKELFGEVIDRIQEAVEPVAANENSSDLSEMDEGILEYNSKEDPNPPISDNSDGNKTHQTPDKEMNLDEILNEIERLSNDGFSDLSTEDDPSESNENENQERPKNTKRSRHKRKRSRSISSPPQEKEAENSAKPVENTEPESKTDPIVLSVDDMKDALTPEDYENHPDLATLRDRLYAQALDYMHQAENRAMQREKKLDAYKTELDRISETITLNQQKFNANVAEIRQKIADEREENKKAIEADKQQAQEAIQNERDALDADRREYEFQVAQLEVLRQNYQSEKNELEEDRRLFEQKIALNKDAPEFVHEQLIALKADNGALQKQLEESATLEEKLDSAKAQIENLESQMGQMIPAEMASIDPAEITNLREQLSDSTAEKNKLLKIVSLQKNAMMAYRDKLDKANQATANCKAELEQVKTQMTSSGNPRELDSLKSRVKELMEENASLKIEISSNKEITESIQAQNDDLKDEIKAIKNKNENSGSRKSRYTMETAMSELTESGIDADVKPGNGCTFLAGTKDGCTVNVNFEHDFVYIEKQCRNTKRHLEKINEWNQANEITYNYWCNNNKIMCRIDYTPRPNINPETLPSLSRMILTACENLNEIK